MHFFQGTSDHDHAPYVDPTTLPARHAQRVRFLRIAAVRRTGAMDAARADVVVALESSVDDPNALPDRTDVPVDPNNRRSPTRRRVESTRCCEHPRRAGRCKGSHRRRGGCWAEATCNRLCEGKGIGTCVGGECIIRCDGKDGCSERVVCPPSIPCRVICAGATSCAAGVDCTQASNCDIQCSGVGSCKGLVQCAGAKCAVSCAEQDSCTRGVNCNADSCDLSCNGGISCAGGVACMAATRTAPSRAVAFPRVGEAFKERARRKSYARVTAVVPIPSRAPARAAPFSARGARAAAVRSVARPPAAPSWEPIAPACDPLPARSDHSAPLNDFYGNQPRRNRRTSKSGVFIRRAHTRARR